MREQSHRIGALGIFIWSIAAVFYLYEFFLRTFVGSIAPQLIHDLSLTVSEFTIIGAAYYIAYGTMQLPVGLLVDRFGVKKALAYSSALCVLSIVVFSQASNFMPAIWGRILMGIGSSFAFVCLLLIVSNWFPKRLFGLLSGVSILIGTMGPALAGGPLISLLNDAHISWRSALYLIAGFGVIITVFIACFVNCKPKSQEVTTKKSSEPLLVQLKQLFHNKQGWFIAVYSATNYVALGAMAAVWGTEYLDTLGFSQSTSAYMISTAWVAYAVACPGFGFLSDLMQRRKPFLVFCSLLGLVSMTLMLYGHFQSAWAYEVLFAMLGIAASGSTLGFAVAVDINKPELRASSLGFNNAVVMLTSAIMPILIGVLVSWSDGSSDAGHMPIHAMTVGLSLLPVMYVISLSVSLFFYRDQNKKPGFVLKPTLAFHAKARMEEA